MNYVKRVGTTYIPVKNPETSSNWYQKILGASVNYLDDNKAILDFANQSFFLVKATNGERTVFRDSNGNEHFSMTFEVNGIEQLKEFHSYLRDNSVEIGEIEDRGHPGENFVFYDLDGNMFDVWSELSPNFREQTNM